jgi:hypothetical protein
MGYRQAPSLWSSRYTRDSLLIGSLTICGLTWPTNSGNNTLSITGQAALRDAISILCRYRSSVKSQLGSGRHPLS